MNQPRIFINETIPVESFTEEPDESSPLRLDDLRDHQIRSELYKYMERLLRRINPLHNTNEMYALRNLIYVMDSEMIMNRILGSTENNSNINNIHVVENDNDVDTEIDAGVGVDMDTENERSELYTSIPDAQPLDPDFIPFENVSMDMDSYVDDSESDNIYQYQINQESLYTIERNHFTNYVEPDVDPNNDIGPDPDPDSEETISYYTTHSGDLPSSPISLSRTHRILQQNSYFQNRTAPVDRQFERRIPQLFKIKRVPITEEMLKNHNKNMCSICLETPTNLQLAVSQCCMNTYCISCIQNWEMTCCNKYMDSSCPLCRKISPDINIFCEIRM